MGFEFKKLSWTNKMAYNVLDNTIRIESCDNVPWGEEKWRVNCCTYRQGTQVQIWDKEKKDLVWIRTPDQVFFGGLSKEEQERLVPVIASGLHALLLSVSKCNSRGKWYFENEEEVLRSFRKNEEDGVPFEDFEEGDYIRRIAEMFIRDSSRLKDHLPEDLYQLLENKIRDYTKMDCSVEHSSVELMRLLICDNENEKKEKLRELGRMVEASTTMKEIGSYLKRLKDEGWIRELKQFVFAMHGSKLFPKLLKDSNGQDITKEKCYEAIKKG